MSDLTFKSCLAPYMIGLIKQRQAIGYKYRAQTDMLIRFDEFCAEIFPDEITITKDMLDIWAAKKSYEASGTLRNRVTVISHLAKYMSSLGIEAYVYPTNELPNIHDLFLRRLQNNCRRKNYREQRSKSALTQRLSLKVEHIGDLLIKGGKNDVAEESVKTAKKERADYNGNENFNAAVHEVFAFGGFEKLLCLHSLECRLCDDFSHNEYLHKIKFFYMKSHISRLYILRLILFSVAAFCSSV